jgi:hypothetical protein
MNRFTETVLFCEFNIKVDLAALPMRRLSPSPIELESNRRCKPRVV